MQQKKRRGSAGRAELVRAIAPVIDHHRIGDWTNASAP
jgi:hypothetical protein